MATEERFSTDENALGGHFPIIRRVKSPLVDRGLLVLEVRATPKRPTLQIILFRISDCQRLLRFVFWRSLPTGQILNLFGSSKRHGKGS